LKGLASTGEKGEDGRSFWAQEKQAVLADKKPTVKRTLKREEEGGVERFTSKIKLI